MDTARPTWTAAPAAYAAEAGFVSALAGPVLALLGEVAGQRVLDLGCGEGTLAALLVGSGADVLAVDSDPAMVDATTARGVPARLADAQGLAGVDGPFDAVVSNAVLHWVSDPDAAAAGIARVLRPGGRLAAEWGGHGNVAAVRVALRAALDAAGLEQVGVPDWWFPTTHEATTVLERAGLVVDHAELVPRPTHVPGGAGAWLRTFVGALEPACEGRFDAVVADAAARAAAVLADRDGAFGADYVRVRVLAHRPT